MFTDIETNGNFNRLGALDTRFTFDKVYSLAFQGGTSSSSVVIPPAPGSPEGTPATVSTAAGPIWEAHFIRAGRTFGLNYDILGIDPEFQPGASPIAGRAWSTSTSISDSPSTIRRTRSCRPGAATFSSSGSGPIATSGNEVGNAKFTPTLNATLRGDGSCRPPSTRAFGYDPSLYANYYLGHISGSDTTLRPSSARTLTQICLLPDHAAIFQILRDGAPRRRT